MLKKKILVIISGKLTFFSSKNFYKLKESFKEYDLEFCLFPWRGQSPEIKKKFLNIYKPIHFYEIENHDFEKDIEKIKFPDHAGNPLGTLNMYKSISISFKIIKKMYDKKIDKPDYVLRFRSDILPKDDQKFINDTFIGQSIIVPDRYHWNGLNDQVFFSKVKTLSVFDDFFKFIDSSINNNDFICPEYNFYKFLKKKKVKTVFFDFNYQILKNQKLINNKELFVKEKKSYIPLRDKINIKILKLLYKLRNFNDFYIKKNKRNKTQNLFHE